MLGVSAAFNVPVTGVVNCRGDATRVVGRETEGVVLLKVLIGSDAERERHGEDSQMTSGL